MKKLILLFTVGSFFIGCAAKAIDNTEPSEPKENTEENTEPSEPKESTEETIEPAEGVMPEVPDVKKPEIEMNILDGNISSGSATLKTENIIKDCKKECVASTISSDEWCDCMHQCSQYFLKVFYRISLGDMNIKIYMEECSSDKDAN
ncbi:MAG: hypothetical protein QF380_03195 [Candidatus Marinimicrobia bacterium]|jgi:hypothetical protein|nr:hypothetical protein [Candidatus Neomarinimicrobiota bacterium]